MNSKTTTLVLATTVIDFCACTLSSAQAAEFTIGAGAGVAPDYEGSKDYKLVPMWNVRAADLWGKPTYAWLLNTNFRSNFLNNENWRLGLSGQYVAERSDVKNNAVDSLHGADSSTMLGVLAGYDFQLAEGRIFGVEVNARYDVVNSNGYLITPGVNYITPLAPNWILSARLGVTWASDAYMSNYFAINHTNANRSGLHQFKILHCLQSGGGTAGPAATRRCRRPVDGRRLRLRVQDKEIVFEPEHLQERLWSPDGMCQASTRKRGLPAFVVVTATGVHEPAPRRIRVALIRSVSSLARKRRFQASEVLTLEDDASGCRSASP